MKSVFGVLLLSLFLGSVASSFVDTTCTPSALSRGQLKRYRDKLTGCWLNIPTNLILFNPDGSVNASIPFLQNITTFYGPGLGAWRTITENPFSPVPSLANEFGIVEQWVGGFRTCFEQDLGIGAGITYGRVTSLDFGLQVIEYVDSSDPSIKIGTQTLQVLDSNGRERFSLEFYSPTGQVFQALRYVSGPRLPVSECQDLINATLV
jgi:hypothetical protein